MQLSELEISDYLDGTHTEYYAPVISSMRVFLENIDELAKSVGGAIIFFQKPKELGQDLTMQVFPFKPNIDLLNPEKCPLNELQRKEILHKINSPKYYQNFWHQKQFREKNQSDEHCAANVPDRNILRFDCNSVTYTNAAEGKDQGEEVCTSWQEFYDNFIAGRVEKNTYEQLLFESGCKGVSFIPIPVLSTPSILLVVNNKYLNTNRHGLFKSLYFRSRDTIDSYLYSRLMDSLIPLLNNYALEKNGEWMMVEAFVEEICNIILPLSYQINEGEVVPYYPHWPTKGFKSVYELPLLDGKYNVKLQLTSFHFVDLDNPDNHEWTWIHKSKIYESIRYQSSVFICKLFKMLHRNFELVQSAERRASNALAKAISAIDIEGLQLKVAEINQGFKVVLHEFGETSPINRITTTDGKVHMYIDAQEIISPNECKNVNQISGFMYLEYILNNSSKKGGSFDVSVSELYTKVSAPKKEASYKPRTERVKEALSGIESTLESIYNGFILFASTYEQEIFSILERREISDNTEFNKSFYFNATLFTRLTASNIGILKNAPASFRGDGLPEDEVDISIKPRSTKLQSQNATDKRKALKESIKDISELLTLYNSIDKEGTSAGITASKAGNELSELNRFRRNITSEKEERVIKNHMRESFKAMFNLLQSQQEKSEGKRKLALKKIITNLRNSGLIKQHNSDAILQKDKYKYDQQFKSPFIAWDQTGFHD